MKKLFAVTAASLLLVSLTGCAGSFDLFQKAYESCGTPTGVSVSDEGKTISIDTVGETDYSGADFADAVCIINAVKTPSYILDNMDTTNSLMGRQTDTFDGIDVSWSYHPDNGLQVVYHKK
jgi:hypothetical protein